MSAEQLPQNRHSLEESGCCIPLCILSSHNIFLSSFCYTHILYELDFIWLYSVLNLSYCSYKYETNKNQDVQL
jgi:hypothetical protein